MQGRVLTFQRAVAVDEWADLNIRLDASIAAAASPSSRVLIIGGTLLAFALCALALRSRRRGLEPEAAL